MRDRGNIDECNPDRNQFIHHHEDGIKVRDSEDHGQSEMVTEENDTVEGKQIVFLISDGHFDWNGRTGHLRQGANDRVVQTGHLKQGVGDLQLKTSRLSQDGEQFADAEESPDTVNERSGNTNGSPETMSERSGELEGG